MTGFLPRDVSSAVLHALAEMPVVVLSGMRQTGKTTFLRKQPELKCRRYVSLDDFDHLAAARRDPETFLSSADEITIDEAHKCPELFPVMKKLVDAGRRPGRFLLSGSANFALLAKLGESLAGRAVTFTLFPFSRRERTRTVQAPSFLEGLFADASPVPETPCRRIPVRDVLDGGFPTVCLKETKDRGLWFKGFEQTYLERDIRELSRIGDLLAFRTLLNLTALRTGRILVVSEIGRDARLNSATAGNYLSLLETSFLISRLAPYLRNKSSRVIKAPKVFFGDSGLACHFADLGEDDFQAGGPIAGSMWETFAFANLSSIVQARLPLARLFFWNVQGRHEVDFIVEHRRKCIAIEVKSGPRWESRDLSGLRAFMGSTPWCRFGILAYNGPRVASLGDGIWGVPLSLLLS